MRQLYFFTALSSNCFSQRASQQSETITIESIIIIVATTDIQFNYLN